MNFPTWVEIDLDCLRDNLTAIRRHTRERRILLVVKADAYGHGAVVVAAEALAVGVDMLGVATVHEGVQLRRAGSMAPILILSPCLTCEVDEIVRYGLRCTISRPSFLSVLAAACDAAGQTLPVHVEVDTGMGRSGVPVTEVEALLAAIDGERDVQLEGLYTHFPDADAAELEPARRQIEAFDALCCRVRTAGRESLVLHAANSAALLHLPAAHLDMVRPGLLAYGLHPGGEMMAGDGMPRVRPVMSFRSRLVQIRQLPAGASISYGRTFRTPQAMRVGVVAAGYGHGLDLALADRGELLVGGQRAPILGRVTMDMTMIDLSASPEAQVEDEVVIFGEQDGAGITLDEVAGRSGTIPYAIMCSIGKRVPRVFRRGGETVRITTLIGERRRRASDRPLAAPIPAPALRPKRPPAAFTSDAAAVGEAGAG